MSGPLNVYTDYESSSTTTFGFSYTGSITDGNFLVLVIYHYAAGLIDASALIADGWTLAITRVYASTVELAIYYKVASSESSPLPDLTISTGRQWVGVLLEYENISGLRGGSAVYSAHDQYPDTPSLTTVSGDEIIAGIGQGSTVSLGLDPALNSEADFYTTNCGTAVGTDQATGTTTGPYEQMMAGGADPWQVLTFILGLIPSGTSSNPPTVINAGSHDQTTTNGTTESNIDASAWFNEQDGTISGYSITRGGSGTTFDNIDWTFNTSTGIITPTTASDASDYAPFTLGITATTEYGSVEETFTVDVNLQVIFTSSKPIKDIDGSNVRTSDATTKYVIFNTDDVSEYDSSTIVQTGTGETLVNDTTQIAIQVPNTDVARNDTGSIIFQDDTDSWATPPIPVTFV